MDSKIMEKVQRFGGAMFTPVMLIAFAGITVGLGTLFTTEAVMGPFASQDGMWFKIWNIILEGGWCVFRQLPLLFVVGLPIGLAKNQAARCCMEALLLYLTFHYFISTILAQWGVSLGVDFTADVGGTSGLTFVAGIKTLDMGMMGALLISGIVIYLHNKYFNTEIPEWLGSFNGSTFIFMIGFLVLLPVAVLSVFIWPHIQHGMLALQNFLSNAGYFGVWVFVLLERLLIPLGLHHLLYFPLFYDSVMEPGGIYAAWSQALPTIAASTEPLKTLFPSAVFTSTGYSKIFGCVGIALAFYATAQPQKRKQLISLLIPITLTSMVCGVTEPIEFTFLFVAPILFVVHAVLSACLATTMSFCKIAGIFSGGLIEWSTFNFLPLMRMHWPQYILLFVIGLVYTGIWFVVFRFFIVKLNLQTPGREENSQAKFYSKTDYRSKQSDKKLETAHNILTALGGANNIIDMTNCVTRLRVNIKDETLVQDDAYFKNIGTRGISKNGKSMQVIIGLNVASIREKIEDILALPAQSEQS